MLFFSSKNKKDSSDGPPERKNIVTLTCPECGFEQTESNLAVSTYCRGCNAHYKIIDGKAQPNKKIPVTHFPSTTDKDPSPKLRPSHDDLQPSSNAPPQEQKETSAKTNQKKEQEIRSTFNKPTQEPKAEPSSLIQKAAASTGLFHTQSKQREVACFECDKVHTASSEASSTLCPACGTYIALKDYTIHSNWNRRIKTRGDVIIHKKASVTGITIDCNHLTTHGDFTGGANCSGDFTIRSHGKIMGKVRCRRLIIEKKAQVEFANTVHCEDAIIDGNVTGNFDCTGKLALQKKATLTGNIKVATMVIEEGARHNGRMSIGQ